MLEVCRDAFAAAEEQFVSCAAQQCKYCLIFTVASKPLRRFTSGECGDMLDAMARIAPP
jgi:hypothetical protein